MGQIGISNHPPKSSSANPMSIFRLVILSLCGILTVANFGIIIHQIVFAAGLTGVRPDGVLVTGFSVDSFEIMGLITSILTLVLVPTFIIVSRTRRSAWIVYALTEIIAFSILWIFWVVLAARAIQTANRNGNCLRFGILSGSCNETVAIEGLSVTTFVLLLIYVLTLIVVATVRSMSRGSSVWFQPVQDLKTSPSNSTVHMMPLASQTTAHGSSGVWGGKPLPDPHTGVPITIAHPSAGQNVTGPSRTGYPAHTASPYAEV